MDTATSGRALDPGQDAVDIAVPGQGTDPHTRISRLDAGDIANPLMSTSRLGAGSRMDKQG